MKPIGLDGFEATFARDDDPWSTWSDRDEAAKREAILHALAAGRTGRILELGAGNGSNSRSLAERALRLDATEATAAGLRLVARAIGDLGPRARAGYLIVPAAPPQPIYDAIVIAELLYYLDDRALAVLARQVARRLRHGGRLVLAHHRITFHDFAQRADAIQSRFLIATGIGWRVRTVRATGRWTVLSCRPVANVRNRKGRDRPGSG